MHGNYGEEVCVVALGFAAIKLGNERDLKRREKEELNDTAHSQGSLRPKGKQRCSVLGKRERGNQKGREDLKGFMMREQ